MSGQHVIPLLGTMLDGPSGPQTIELKQLLGSGAFGFVYEGADRGSLARYAIKFPQVAVETSSELLAFQNEVAAAKEIQHTNVVPVLFVAERGTDSLPPYLVMPYIEGGTLAAHLKGRRAAKEQIPAAIVRAWFDNLISGIEAINHRMLHRDLKPDNILLDGDSLRISDFGLSKIIGAATRSRSFKGGQHMLYMAPEGWKLETNTISIDMYSMGIVMFEIASLTFPYDLPKDPRDLEDMHLFQVPKRLATIRNDLPGALEQVLLKLLDKRAADRFAAWSDVRVALDRAWAGVTSVATPSDAVRRYIAATTHAQVAQAERRLESERAEAKRADRVRMESFAREKLLAQLRAGVDACNAANVADRIDTRGSADSWTFASGLGGSVTVRFHRLGDEALPSNRGDILFFASFNDERGAGFNAILVRKTADDLYGTWEGWEFAGNMGHRPAIEPVGFNRIEDFRENYVGLRGVTHVYKAVAVSDVTERLVGLLADSMARRAK